MLYTIRYMSYIGNKPILIPNGVNVKIASQKIYIKGLYGDLERSFLNLVSLNLNSNNLYIIRNVENKNSRSYHGLLRKLIENMILGVQKKFFRILIAEGVGYKFQIKNNILIINVGFTHLVNLEIPSDISLTLESPTKISISGVDKEKVTLFASKIYNIKPPEPYKGKGILYEKQQIRRKAGKTRK